MYNYSNIFDGKVIQIIKNVHSRHRLSVFYCSTYILVCFLGGWGLGLFLFFLFLFLFFLFFFVMFFFMKHPRQDYVPGRLTQV